MSTSGAFLPTRGRSARGRSARGRSARLRTQLAAVARAGRQSTIRHIVLAVGSRRRATALAVALAAVVVIANIVIAGFYDSLLGDLLGDTGLFTDGERATVLSTLVTSTCVVGAAIALLVAMIAPPSSRIALASRIAGAGRGAVAVGEFVPAAGAVLLVIVATSAAPIVVTAVHLPLPPLSALALLLASFAFALAAMAVRGGVARLLQRLGLGDAASRAVGALAAVVSVGGVMTDVGLASLHQRDSIAALALHALWGGRAAPETPGDLLSTLAAFALAAVLAVVAATGTGLKQPLEVGWKIVGIRSWGRPSGIHNAVVRELLLYLRHPVTTVSLITLGVLVAAAAAGARAGVVPPLVVVLLFAVLFAAGAETAHGRTRSFAWIHRAAGSPVHARMLAQVGAVGLVQFALFLGAILLAVPLEDVGASLRSSAPTFVALLSLSYFAGVLIPYSEDAPLGAAATSGLVLALEVSWLGLESQLGQIPFALRLALQLAVAAAAITAAIALARRREDAQ